MSERSRSDLALRRPDRAFHNDTLIEPFSSVSSEEEDYRFLRYSLLRRLSSGRCNVIAVAAASGGGDSATALNLAFALEEPGIFRVLLVDADLRKATITRELARHAGGGGGLHTALEDWSLRLEDCARYVPEPFGLTVLPTAARPDSAGRLLASPRFGLLMVQARQQYDFVIVSTPPLVPTADCRAMAPWLDGFVIVVTAHQTTRGVLEQALSGMREEQVLGLVFSGADRSLRSDGADSHGCG